MITENLSSDVKNEISESTPYRVPCKILAYKISSSHVILCIILERIKILTACKFLSYTPGTFLSEIPFIHAGPLSTLASPPIALM